MQSGLQMDSEYKHWLSGLKEKIRNSQLKAALKVNAELLNLYWQLGHAIVEKQEKSDWGDKIIAQLAKDLNAEFKDMSGFSRSNLFNIRKWYLFFVKDYQLVQQGVGLIGLGSISDGEAIVQHDVGLLPAALSVVPWGHQIQVVAKCRSVEEAIFYLQQTTLHNWKRSVLEYQIESGLFLRKGKAQNNFQLVMPLPESELASELLNNPYNLDFLGLGAAITERDLENAIIANIKSFLLELGTGFAFMGQQVPIRVGDKDFRIDLLFYHTRLHAHFVVELKVTEFEPEFAGKLEFYVEAIDQQLKKEGDNPTIGLLLCKSADKIVVEYALNTRIKPIGVATYRHTNQLPKELENDLPDAESLKLELSKKIVVPQKQVDEKMERLQKLIKTLNADEAVMERTPAVTREIFNKVALPLIGMIDERLKEIKPLFTSSKISILFNEHSANEVAAASEIEASILPEEKTWLISFAYNLEGFKKAGTKYFSLFNHKIQIELEKLKYTIYMERNKIWDERLFHKIPSKEELVVFADRFAEIVIDEIETKIGSLIS